MKIATNVMFTQISEKEGIKKFGEKAAADVVKEYRKIYKGLMEGNPVQKPIGPDKLFYKDKRMAPEMFKLIK